MIQRQYAKGNNVDSCLPKRSCTRWSLCMDKSCRSGRSVSIKRLNDFLPSSVHLKTPASFSTFTKTLPTSCSSRSRIISLVLPLSSPTKPSAHGACFWTDFSEEISRPSSINFSITFNYFCRRDGRTASPITSISPIFSFLIWWYSSCG